MRLKSGDPLIFGRAGEEIEALRRANIAYEIVPGVTSALGAAAAAGIPLTHRQASSTLVLTAGHRASGNSMRNGAKFAGAEWTLVVYMPGTNYAENRRQAHGVRFRSRNSLRDYFPGNNSSSAGAPHHGFESSSVAETRISDFAGGRRGCEICRSRSRRNLKLSRRHFEISCEERAPRGAVRHEREEVGQLQVAAETWTPQHVLGWAFDTFGNAVAISSAFGAEGMVLIDIASRVRQNFRLFTLDTEFLFPETYNLMDKWRKVRHRD